MATQEGTVSVGNDSLQRRITNVAAGIDDNDAVTIAQLRAIASPFTNSLVLAAMSPQLGPVSSYASDPYAQALGEDSVAFGASSIASELGAIALGSQAQASGVRSVALGDSASASGTGSVASGTGASASGMGSVAVGNGASASATGSVALGVGAVASGVRSVALGDASIAARNNDVSIGSPGNERTISNVAPGILATDAVNMNQLNSLDSRLTQRINQQTATMLAMVQTVSAPQKPGKCRMNVGVGVQGSEAGYAVGVGCLNEKGTLNYSLGVGTGPNQKGLSFRAGLGWDLPF